MSSNININTDALMDKISRALYMTAEEVVTDLKNSETVPFDTGDLQGNTVVNPPERPTSIIIGSYRVYARRCYFHPEFNFQKTNNANAGAYWFEPYVNGNKKDFIRVTFAEFMKRG